MPRAGLRGTVFGCFAARYGFEKLKLDGRISGDTATEKLVVEDRSPLLGSDRIEFDSCFAGKDWSLTR